MVSRKPKPETKTASEAPAPGRALDASGRAYWLTRASKFAEQGQAARLHETLDRLWADRLAPERLAWLAVAAPAMLATALANTSEPVPEVLLGALARTLLEWPDDVAEAVFGLSCLPVSFVADARALRESSTCLASGDDPGAAAALKRVGRDSPLRDAQRFLRGLGAFYRADAEGALLALAPLLTVAAWSAPAAALLHRLGRHPEAPAPVLARLPEAPAAQVASIVRALADRHPNKAISLLAAALPKVAPALARALVRDFPGALLAQGVPDESVVERLKRAIPNLKTLVDPRLLDALICERMGYREEAFELFATLVGAWRTAGPARAADAAASLHRLGAQLLEALDRGEGRPERCPDCGRFHDVGPDQGVLLRAIHELLEDALRLAPDELDIWTDLVRAVEAGSDKATRGRVLERFVARFPDHPTALLSAAEACLERGAFDKGLDYAEAAAEHLPFDRSPRQVACKLLMEKARKKFRDDRRDEAMVLLERALAVPHLDPDTRQRASAAFVATRIVLAKETDFVEQRAQATRDDPRPWVWSFRFAHEWWRLHAVGRKRNRMTPLPKAAQALPSDPLGREEMAALLRAWRDLSEQEPVAQGVVAGVLAGAGARSPEALATARDCLDVLFIRSTPEAHFGIARRGLEVDPEGLDFCLVYYETALRLKKPASTYDGADARLADLLRRHAGILHFQLGTLDRIKALRQNIAAVVRAAAGPSAVPDPKAKPKQSSKTARAPAPAPAAAPVPAPAPAPAAPRPAAPEPEQLPLPWE